MEYIDSTCIAKCKHWVETSYGGTTHLNCEMPDDGICISKEINILYYNSWSNCDYMIVDWISYLKFNRELEVIKI